MKKYSKPNFIILTFKDDDILTTSSTFAPKNDYESSIKYAEGWK